MDTKTETEKESPVILSFYPKVPENTSDTDEYKAIWQQDGQRITSVLEQVSGLKFQEREIKVEVRDGYSSAGIKDGDGVIKMRANYDIDRKRSCVIHELGHRLLHLNGITRTKDLSEHKILYLVLYDVWEKLYGKDFASRQVKIEKGIPQPMAPYKECWEYALSLSKTQREEGFDKVKSSLHNFRE